MSSFCGRRLSHSQQSQPRAWLCVVVAEGPFVIPPWTPSQVFPGGGSFVYSGAWRLLPWLRPGLLSSPELGMTLFTELPSTSSPPSLCGVLCFYCKRKKKKKDGNSIGESGLRRKGPLPFLGPIPTPQRLSPLPCLVDLFGNLSWEGLRERGKEGRPPLLCILFFH